ncbi:MAG: glycosyltransferase family 9 protein, partial [Nitrospirota bacterium]
MREILLINLTRMGDLLQTTPLMAGLKERYPEARITLLVNSSFTEICRGIPYIDELIDFDMKGYRERLIGEKYSLVENYRFMEALISRLNSREYDLTINITHSPISAILTSFIRTKEVRGFSIDS